VVTLVFPDGFSLGELAYALFVQVSSDKRLVHLLVSVEFIDVKRRETNCLAHVVEGWTSLVSEVATHG
jgi:hypothetical protein